MFTIIPIRFVLSSTYADTNCSKISTYIEKIKDISGQIDEDVKCGSGNYVIMVLYELVRKLYIRSLFFKKNANKKKY